MKKTDQLEVLAARAEKAVKELLDVYVELKKFGDKPCRLRGLSSKDAVRLVGTVLKNGVGKGLDRPAKEFALPTQGWEC
jgi:hypothetical protein